MDLRIRIEKLKKELEKWLDNAKEICTHPDKSLYFIDPGGPSGNVVCCSICNKLITLNYKEVRELLFRY